MSTPSPVKLLPRNVAAFRRSAPPTDPLRVTPGNPVSTRLESGVGNCFPGLECDLRNLERRFFPFLEVDALQGLTRLRVIAVDVAGVNAAEAAGDLDATTAEGYRRIAQDMPAAPTGIGRAWMIQRIRGTFAALDNRTLTLDLPIDNASSFGDDREPIDAWTAIRMLREGSEVEIEVDRAGSPRVTLRGRRARYLDDNGALADIFLPGELTQSLCSPWTHDFRDCGCYYWASNHPDIALPPDPPTNTTDLRWNLRVLWQRTERTPGQPPTAATADGPVDEMAYHDINRDWQRLNFVLEGREHTGPYKERASATAVPFAEAELDTQLRYAAGVELAVMQAYLAAAFSLRDPATVANPQLADDLQAAHYEIMRIAVGEMRHVRAVRDVLASRATPPFDPPLRVATRVPGQGPTDAAVMLLPAALTPDVLDVFIDIEGPNVAVDGLYARILATLEVLGNNPRAEQAIRRIMTEGEDHQKAFKAIREWLRPYTPAQYLRAATLTVPPAGDATNAALQGEYLAILESLHTGYSQTTLAGAAKVNEARDAMVQRLRGACEDVARAGFLVTFAHLADPRFAPIDPP